MILRPMTYVGLAILLMVTLTTGVILHASIPHKHSHDGEPTSAAWDSMHSALRGEDKKMLATVQDSLGAFTSFILLIFIIELGQVLNLYSLAQKSPNNLTLALRKGIVAYRAFR